MKAFSSSIKAIASSLVFISVTSTAYSTPVSLDSSSKTSKEGAGSRRDVHLIYMGGDDCPPCVAWRRDELPKLEKTDALKQSRFTYVVKSIRSPVPSRLFLPAEVKDYKAKLDAASGGFSGSPQFALMVNGEVYDYYGGARDAATVEKMLTSARTGDAYPTKRCVQRSSFRTCAKELD